MEYCIANKSTVVDCGFEALTSKPGAGYPPRLEATVVVDCNVNESAVVDCGFQALEFMPCDG